MCNECSTSGRFLKTNKLMEEIENYYIEEDYIHRTPDDGFEEIDIEPIDWDCV